MKVSWPTLLEEIARCEGCPLCRGIQNKVPGQGDADARLMLIGEGPGAEEDRQGLAFVGPAGRLLTNMLSAIGLSRDEVYIANVVKCRPPNNRVPTQEEADQCKAFLRAQTALVRPQVILLLGSTALRCVISPDARITRMRGQWIQRKGIWIMPTYHPAALLRDPDKKRDAWHDLKMVRDKMAELGDKQIEQSSP